MNDSDIRQLLPLIYADFGAPYNTVKKRVEITKPAYMNRIDKRKEYIALQQALENFFK